MTGLMLNLQVAKDDELKKEILRMVAEANKALIRSKLKELIQEEASEKITGDAVLQTVRDVAYKRFHTYEGKSIATEAATIAMKELLDGEWLKLVRDQYEKIATAIDHGSEKAMQMASHEIADRVMKDPSLSSSVAKALLSATGKAIEVTLGDEIEEPIEGYTYWQEHPDYPVRDWLYNVTNQATRRGYWSWMKAEIASRK